MTPQQPSNFHCHLVNAQGLGRVGPDTHRITEGATEWSFVFGSHPRLAHVFVLNRGSRKDARIRE